MAWENLAEELEAEFFSLSQCIDTRRRELVFKKHVSFCERYQANPEQYRAKGRARVERWRQRRQAERDALPREGKQTHKLTPEQKHWLITCDRTTQKAADELGVCRQYVSRLRAEARGQPEKHTRKKESTC